MLLILCICLLWLPTSGLWGIQAEDPNPEVDTRRPHRSLAPTNVDFAFRLFKHLVTLTPNNSIFISPVTVSMSLAMLSLGAGSSMRTQLLQGLGFDLTKVPEAEIHQDFQHLQYLLEKPNTRLEMVLGNTLFLDQRLKALESFSAGTKRYYKSEVLAIDFQDWVKASRQINECVKNKTQGKIVDLFLETESPATLVLVNYIFLKGTWEHPFDPESTSEEDFYVSGTSTVKVPMMFQSRVIAYLHDSELPCRLVQLDYTSNRTVFFILPDEGEMDTVIAGLTRDTIQRWSSALSLGLVDLHIPRISISATYDLKDTLVHMGIVDLFTSQANFSGISQESQLKVPKVVHKAVLHLDETGTKPATTPGGAPNLRALLAKPPIIKFNRPFVIAIFDDMTWSSVFLGKVVNPT
ncbi:PREDICTED: corticosteroid-binding globulin [Chrysochloris asiatica]|uniref:Corticosteroid-binding globulin n=1 Tax=Chrysochloris asiatica TaxID=185453 RepID=A0A9B0TBH8_CHRAS|nr:PREDICTED: corticosteroid-binding globulin [Chrysochloris asiatica]